MDVFAGGTISEGELKARYERYKNIIDNFTLMSDIFMRNVFKKKECLEYVLQIILQNHKLFIAEHIIQKDYKNLQGRSAVMDCVARDADGQYFNIEIQQENEGASPNRARYNSGLMDMNMLNPGQDFDELTENYVIFITRNDILGYGLAIYHVERVILEVDGFFGDGTHIIYVNSKIQEDTELGRLMHDFHCKKAEDMYSRILADRVYELKETQKGVEFMCQEMEQIYYEGEKSGELKARKETAMLLVEDGMDISRIARLMKVTEQDIHEWIDESMCIAK
ncbi:MAG: PD-(D/E)XK nuclease family transposase [Coprococcus sp.]